MLKPKILEIDCPDVPNVNTWQPSKPEDLFLGVEIKIGVAGEIGADDFQLLVASKQAIRKYKKIYDEKYFARCYIMEEFDWGKVVGYIEEKVSLCSGDNWKVIGSCLQKYFRWEYENFRWIADDED